MIYLRVKQSGGSPILNFLGSEKFPFLMSSLYWNQNIIYGKNLCNNLFRHHKGQNYDLWGLYSNFLVKHQILGSMIFPNVWYIIRKLWLSLFQNTVNFWKRTRNWPIYQWKRVFSKFGVLNVPHLMWLPSMYPIKIFIEKTYDFD